MSVEYPISGCQPPSGVGGPVGEREKYALDIQTKLNDSLQGNEGADHVSCERAYIQRMLPKTKATHCMQLQTNEASTVPSHAQSGARGCE